MEQKSPPPRHCGLGTHPSNTTHKFNDTYVKRERERRERETLAGSMINAHQANGSGDFDRWPGCLLCISGPLHTHTHTHRRAPGITANWWPDMGAYINYHLWLLLQKRNNQNQMPSFTGVLCCMIAVIAVAVKSPRVFHLPPGTLQALPMWQQNNTSVYQPCECRGGVSPS